MAICIYSTYLAAHTHNVQLTHIKYTKMENVINISYLSLSLLYIC